MPTDARATHEYCVACRTRVTDVPTASPCPSCGSLQRFGTTEVPGASAVVAAGAIGITSRRLAKEYAKKHRVLFPVLLAVTFGPPWLSLCLSPSHGVLAGLIAGGVGLWVGFHASATVLEYEVRREA